MADPVKNFAKCPVSGGYSSTDTVITLQSGEGAKLPNPTADGEFNLVWWDYSDYPDPSGDPNVEIVRCTARTDDVLTVSRHEEDTTASAKNISGKTYMVALSFTAGLYDDLKAEILTSIYPVGSIFISGSSTMPTAIASIGTWTRIQGRMIVGASDTDADFDNGDTGGEKTHTLTTAEMPSHYHTVNPPATATGGQSADHAHAEHSEVWMNQSGSSNKFVSNGSSWWHNTQSVGGRGVYYTGGTTSNHTHTVDIAQFNSGNNGSGNAHTIMNPYKARYMWERTA